MISAKQAEKMIYSMVKYSDHVLHYLRSLSDDEIKKWFEHNGYSWSILVAESRILDKAIPFVENLFGYELILETSNETSFTVFHYGHETVKLSGSGHISIFDFHTKFIEALKFRSKTIKSKSATDLFSFVTYGVASVESYITSKAYIWNKSGKQPLFKIDNSSNLDEKLNNWLYIMTKNRMSQAGAVWNYFMDFKNLNNVIVKHNSTGSNVISYDEMVKLINKFKKGFAELLFRLHQYFGERVPSKIIRAMYLPDVSLN